MNLGMSRRIFQFPDPARWLGVAMYALLSVLWLIWPEGLLAQALPIGLGLLGVAGFLSRGCYRLGAGMRNGIRYSR